MFLPAQEVMDMLKAGMHVAQVKDVLQMMVLHACGGWFIDLDMIWLGRGVAK